MSFEGYYQFLCKQGHSFNIDVYEVDNKAPKCPACKEPAIWRNLVDQTNGTFDNNGITRIDGFIELEVKTKEKTCVCQACGDKHITEQMTFEIPKDGGVLLALYNIETKVQDGNWEFYKEYENEEMAVKEVMKMMKAPLGTSCMYQITVNGEIFKTNQNLWNEYKKIK